MKKVCIVVSQVDRAIAFEWIVEGLRKRFDFYFVLIGKRGSYLEHYLEKEGVECCVIDYKGKRDALKAVWKTFQYLRRKKIDVVHTHLVEATLYGLFSAWLLRIKRRIYTRHHSDYNYKYSPKGIKYDRLSNWLATDVVAITRQVESLLVKKENVPLKKITIIHHGVDTDYLEKRDVENLQKLSLKYNQNNRSPVIGVVARQQHWKGIQYVIPAFAEILKKHPNALLILANAGGDYEPEIDRLMKEQLIEGSYFKIRYEYDNSSLFKLFDVFVHVPIDHVVEAFGQVYIESLAAGIPSVFTKSGIAVDFIKDGVNALVVPYCDSTSITRAVLTLLDDKELQATIVANGRRIVQERFSLGTFYEKLANLYDK